MEDYDDPVLPPEVEEEWPRDAKVDEAKETLLAELFGVRHEVFYGRQVAILFERKFYHWITTKAINELATEGKIWSLTMPLVGSAEGETIRFYWSKRTRYFRRQIQEIQKIVQEFSTPSMMRALGLHGEMMFDVGLSHFGWVEKRPDVRAFGGREWTKTGHNLDRIYGRDGIEYGVEVKNALSYIDRKELEIKIEMCRHLHVRPLFIMRMAPTNYIELVRLAGGFTLVFEWQLYPYGQSDLAKRVRARLGLKVDCPRVIEDGTMQRLVNWHVKQLAG